MNPINPTDASVLTDISYLSNVDKSTISKFYELLEDVISQRLLELITDNPNESQFKIELPILGALSITINEGTPEVSLVVSCRFANKLSTVTDEGVSSLYNTIMDSLIRSIVDEYNNLL